MKRHNSYVIKNALSIMLALWADVLFIKGTHIKVKEVIEMTLLW